MIFFRNNVYLDMTEPQITEPILQPDGTYLDVTITPPWIVCQENRPPAFDEITMVGSIDGEQKIYYRPVCHTDDELEDLRSKWVVLRIREKWSQEDEIKLVNIAVLAMVQKLDPDPAYVDYRQTVDQIKTQSQDWLTDQKAAELSNLKAWQKKFKKVDFSQVTPESIPTEEEGANP